MTYTSVGARNGRQDTGTTYGIYTAAGSAWDSTLQTPSVVCGRKPNCGTKTKTLSLENADENVTDQQKKTSAMSSAAAASRAVTST